MDKKRLSLVAITLMVLASGTALFFVSQRVQREERAIAAIAEQLAKEHESTRVLTAEWAYLNRPDRLEGLAENPMLQPASVPATLENSLALDIRLKDAPVPSHKPTIPQRAFKQPPVDETAPQTQPMYMDASLSNVAPAAGKVEAPTAPSRAEALEQKDDTTFTSLIDNLGDEKTEGTR
ncbi:MAG: hypothetical protein AB7E85_07740 [Pseudobdellovibrionaceae bacterium]